MDTRKRVTEIVKQRFQYHRLWGTESHGWNNGAIQGVYLGDYSADHPEAGVQSGNDAPTGIYTVAWFLDCTAKMWAAINEADPDDLNVYVEINITCKRNKLWTSNDVVGGGFIDIGAIYLNPSSSPQEWTHNGTAALYLGNKAGARQQLENDIGVSRGSWLGGVIADTHDKDGMTIHPDIGHGSLGPEGQYSNGYNDAGWELDYELVFGPEAYDEDGKMKIESIPLPFYIALRWWEAAEQVKVGLYELFDFDIVGDNPFAYVPWAIRKTENDSSFWRSCNDHKNAGGKSNGLVVYKNGSFSHIVINSPLNPKVPGDSNGFRVTDKTKSGINKWSVSPKTPEDS